MRKKLLVVLGMFLFGISAAPMASLAAEKSVMWLGIGPLTGPGAAAVAPFAMGAREYLTDLNERGGVDGVKINYVAVDDRYDVARGMSAYRRYRVEPKLVIINVHSTALVKAMAPLVEEDKIVARIGGAGEYQANIGRMFLFSAPYQDGFGAALDWMVADWQKKGNTGKPTVGYLGWDNASGIEPLKGGQEYAERIGVKLLAPEFYPPGSLKHDIWLNRLHEGGAKYIYIQGVDPSHTNVIRDAYALGLKDKITFMSDFWGPMDNVGIRSHPKELEGTFIVSPYIRGEELQGHSIGVNIWKKYHKEPLSEMSLFWLSGIGQALMNEETLKIALKDVGYEKLDGDAFLRATEKLHGMDVTKGQMGVCDYSKTSRRASKEVKFYKIMGGKAVPVSGWVAAPDTISLYKY